MTKTMLAVACAIVLSGPAAIAAQQQPPTAQSEYVPAKPGAATEQLPAGPLLIAAYGFVWLAAMGYVWTVARRLTKIEHDLRALEQRAGQKSR